MLTQHLGERLRDEIWRNPDRHQTRSLGEIYLQFPFPQVEAQTHRSSRSSCGSSRGADLPPCPAVHLSVCLSATLIRGLLAPPLSSSFFFVIILFVYFWLLCVFVALRGLSLVAVNRGFSLVVVHGLLVAEAPLAQGCRCAVFSSCGHTDSAVAMHRLSCSEA